jgi:hypothetical protein
LTVNGSGFAANSIICGTGLVSQPLLGAPLSSPALSPPAALPRKDPPRSAVSTNGTTSNGSTFTICAGDGDDQRHHSLERSGRQARRSP